MKIYSIISFLLIAATSFAAVQAPQLKWNTNGGAPYTMSGVYAGSPAVADLDGDGRQEVIWANNMIYVIDGASGELVWNAYTGHDKTFRDKDNIGGTYPAVAVADLDNDGKLEIVTGHGEGIVAVYTHDGYFYSPDWPTQLAPNSEIRSLCLADLNNDNKIEILAGTTRKIESEHDWYVLKLNGEFYEGWPQDNKNAGTHGAFHQSTTVGDLDNDGFQEVVCIADRFYLNGFKHTGECLNATPSYKNKIWADIPIWYKLSSELAGYSDDGEYFPKFPFSSPVMSDVDSDGSLEIILVSYIHDLIEKPAIPMFHSPMIFTSDRERYQKNGFDWRNFATPPDFEEWPALTHDYQVAKVCTANPTPADLDNDGYKEILFPANDGRIHAYWLDQTEHYNWPFELFDPNNESFRFGSECAVADLDNDGKSEVIFGTWPKRSSSVNGHLYILDYKGNVLHKIEIINGDNSWNGITSAPTIANIDDDPELEIIVGTAYSGLCAYDLPGTENAKVQWKTGQGNFQRTANVEAEVADNQSNIEKINQNPINFTLGQNYPNPFNSQTIIPVQMQFKSQVSLEIFDVLGRKIQTIYNGNLEAGTHAFKLNSADTPNGLSAGIYYCVLKSNLYRQVSKVIYLP